MMIFLLSFSKLMPIILFCPSIMEKVPDSMQHCNLANWFLHFIFLLLFKVIKELTSKQYISRLKGKINQTAMKLAIKNFCLKSC
jgi:hypothetical protein